MRTIKILFLIIMVVVCFISLVLSVSLFFTIEIGIDMIRNGIPKKLI